MDSQKSPGRTAAVIAVVVVLLVFLVWLFRRSSPAHGKCGKCPAGQACDPAAKNPTCEPEGCLMLWPFARPTIPEFEKMVADAWAHRDATGIPMDPNGCWGAAWAPIAQVEAWVEAARGGDLTCALPARVGRPTQCALNKFAALRGRFPADEVCRRPGATQNTNEGYNDANALVCGDDCRWRYKTCTFPDWSGQGCLAGGERGAPFERYEGAWPAFHLVNPTGLPSDPNVLHGENSWAVNAYDVFPNADDTDPVSLVTCENKCRGSPACSGYSYDASRGWCALWPPPASAAISGDLAVVDQSAAPQPATGYVYGLNRSWQANLPAACAPATLPDSKGVSHDFDPQGPYGSGAAPAGCWMSGLPGDALAYSESQVSGTQIPGTYGRQGTLLKCAQKCMATADCDLWSYLEGSVNGNTNVYDNWGYCALYSGGSGSQQYYAPTGVGIGQVGYSGAV